MVNKIDGLNGYKMSNIIMVSRRLPEGVLCLRRSFIYDLKLIFQTIFIEFFK